MTIDTLINQLLEEDLGPAGLDVSVAALGAAAAHPATGRVKAKQRGVLCGSQFILPVIRAVEARRAGMEGTSGIATPSSHPTECRIEVTDGAGLEPGSVVALLRGPVGTLLTAERTLLNLLQRLSGVATATRAFVEAMAGTGCRLLDTRKTTPGLRALEKLAVRVGGGSNHRFGLYDMVMLKDNHLTALGGDIARAVRQARERFGPALRVEVETASLDQVRAAVEARADLIMLDNMELDMMRAAVALVDRRVPLEASGGVTLSTVAAIAATGVDYVSVGAITHSAPALDLNMKITLDSGR